MKQAKPCTGSVQQKAGVWYTVIQVTIGGKRKSKWETTGLPIKGNKRKAQEILEKRKLDYTIRYMAGQYSLGDFCNEGHLLFSDYLERWTQSQAQTQGLSYTTTRSREQMTASRIRRYFDPRGITLVGLTPEDIEDFLDTLRQDGLKGTTLIHYHQFMSQAIKTAVRKDIITRNPFDKVDRPKKNRYEAAYFRKEEVPALLAAFADDAIYMPVLMCVYYGFRRSEVLGLKWECIDFERNTISVKFKVEEVMKNGKMELVISDQLKTKTSRRTLPLVPIVREALLKEKARQEELRKVFRKGYSKEYSEMICVDPLGKLHAPTYVSDHYDHIRKKAGLRHVTFHGLRHTCASLLAAHGVDMKRIQIWLGHANYSTTADIYSHLDAGAQELTAAAISSALDGAVGGLGGVVTEAEAPEQQVQ